MNETQKQICSNGNVLKTKAHERDKAWKQMSMKMHNVRRMNENVHPTPIFTVTKKKYGLLKNSYAEMKEQHIT